MKSPAIQANPIAHGGRNRRFTTLTALWLLVGSWALGQDDVLFLDIDDVVGATGYEQKIARAPASVAVLSAPEISALGLRTLSEALETLAGVYVFDTRNSFSLSVRGFTEMNEPNNFLILVDGLQLNDITYGAAPLAMDLGVDLEIVEKIELIRGPTSSVYGANALSGIINIVTKRGRDLDGHELSLSTGELGDQRYRWSYGAKRGEFEWLVSLSGGKQDGPNILFYEEFQAGPSAGLSQNTDWERYGAAFLKLRARAWTLTAGGNDFENGLSTVPATITFNSRDNRIKLDSHFLNLSYSKAFADGDSLDTRLYYNNMKETLDFKLGIPGLPPLINRTFTHGIAHGLESRFRKRINPQTGVVLGLEYRRQERLELTNELVDFNTLHDGIHTNDIKSLYAQGEWEGAFLHLYLGARYDHFGTFGDAFNPRAAVIFGDEESRAIKLLYGTAFRAPSSFETYFQSPGGFLPNLALEPEEVESFELVWEQRFQAVYMRLAAYQNDADDLINLLTQPDSGFLINVNQGVTQTRGFEMELNWQPRINLAVRMSLTHQDVSVTQTDQFPVDMPQIQEVAPPQNMVRLVLTWRSQTLPVNLGTNWSYIDERTTVAGRVLDPFAVGNLHVKWSPHQRIHLSAIAKNLLNEFSLEPGAPSFTPDVIEQQGRTLRLRLNLSW